MVYPRIGVSYGEWLNRTHDPCDEEHCNMIGTVQQTRLSMTVNMRCHLYLDTPHLCRLPAFEGDEN